MRKHTKTLLVIGLALAALVALLILQREPQQPSSEAGPGVAISPAAPSPDLTINHAAKDLAPAASRVTEEPDDAPAYRTPTAATRPKTGPVRIRKGEPIPQLFPYEAQRDEIIRLSTLAPESGVLSSIAAYLKHEDANVREEARTALLRLSSPLAIPYLKEAAASAKSTAEADNLREAAEFLTLAQEQASPSIAETPTP
jgi:hypothetical protein